MKTLARQYLWWPNLDKEIERVVKDCNSCKSNASQPPKAKLVKFIETKRVFEIIHLDFAVPFHGKCSLILVDAFSKWPEVAEVSTMDSMQTIEKFRKWFARFGLPDVIISDNGRQFTSDALKIMVYKLERLHHITLLRME